MLSKKRIYCKFGTLHLGGSTKKITIGNVVNVPAYLYSGKCEHGDRSIVTQVCGDVGDAKFVVNTINWYLLSSQNLMLPCHLSQLL